MSGTEQLERVHGHLLRIADEYRANGEQHCATTAVDIAARLRHAIAVTPKPDRAPCLCGCETS